MCKNNLIELITKRGQRGFSGYVKKVVLWRLGWRPKLDTIISCFVFCHTSGNHCECKKMKNEEKMKQIFGNMYFSYRKYFRGRSNNTWYSTKCPIYFYCFLHCFRCIFEGKRLSKNKTRLKIHFLNFIAESILGLKVPKKCHVLFEWSLITNSRFGFDPKVNNSLKITSHRPMISAYEFFIFTLSSHLIVFVSKLQCPWTFISVTSFMNNPKKEQLTS